MIVCRARPFLLGLGAVLAAACWAQQAPTAPAAGSAPASKPAAASEELQPMTRAVVQRGALQCAARVEQVSKVLGSGPDTQGMVLAPATPVDRLMLSVVMAQPASGGDSGVIGLDFAPNQANGCGASLQAVAYWPKTCDALAQDTMATLKKLPPLRPDVQVLDAGPTSKVFLLKAGSNGCVSIKKEVIL